MLPNRLSDASPHGLIDESTLGEDLADVLAALTPHPLLAAPQEALPHLGVFDADRRPDLAVGDESWSRAHGIVVHPPRRRQGSVQRQEVPPPGAVPSTDDVVGDAMAAETDAIRDPFDSHIDTGQPEEDEMKSIARPDEPGDPGGERPAGQVVSNAKLTRWRASSRRRMSMIRPAVIADALRIEGRQPPRDHIGVHELIDREGIAKQVGADRALPGSVGTREHDNTGRGNRRQTSSPPKPILAFSAIAKIWLIGEPRPHGTPSSAISPSGGGCPPP